jgi:RNA polymerase sigma factor (sigma-70 family)
MPDGRLAAVVQRLQALARAEQGGEPTDGQLVERFAGCRDEDAFGLLVRRHGPMVLGVCRRLLGHEQDAEDAFQATFLILARQAASVRARAALGGWLYRVALRVALSVKGRAGRGPAPGEPAAERAGTDPAAEAAWREIRPLLDEEVRRLPEKYRVPVVLCYLEGKTHEAAAAELGWPRGTVAGRLARARDLLRTRLTRRGVTLSAGALAAGLSEAGASAVPEGLAHATAESAARFAAEKAGPGLSAHAAVLARGVLHAMFLTRLKVAGAVLLLAALLAGVGSIALGGLGPAEGGGPKGAGGRAPPGAAKASAPKVQDGLAITVRPLKAVFDPKESPAVEVTLKNVSKEALTLHYPPLWDYPFRRFLIEEVKSGRRQTAGLFFPDEPILRDKRLAPGESWVAKQELAHLFPVPREGERLSDPVRLGPGKYRVKAAVKLHANPRGKGLYWSGELTSAWAEVEVAAPPGKEAKEPPRGDHEALLGTWRVVDAEVEGRDVGEGAFERQTRWVITRDRIALLDGPGIETGAWGYKLDSSKTPKEIDLKSLRGRPGPAMPSVYQLSGDRLKVCIGDTGGVRPKALRTQPGKPGPILYTLKREPPPKAEKPAGKVAPPGKASVYAALSVRTPSGWYLSVSPDGGGVCGYGSHGPDMAFVRAGTFEMARLAEELKKRSGPVGTVQDSYTVALHRKGERTTVAIYTKDARFVAELFATARARAERFPGGRLESLWSLRPPTPLNAGPWRARPRELRPAEPPFAVALSPDGKLAATGYRPRVWDTATGKATALPRLRKPESTPGPMPANPPGPGPFAVPARHEPVRAVTFSPDGRTLATGGSDGSVRLWEVRTYTLRLAFNEPRRPALKGLPELGQRVLPLPTPPKAAALSLAFRPDGRVLAAAFGKTVGLWDVASGKKLALCAGHKGVVLGVAFSPDGKLLASAGEDWSVRLWDAVTGKEVHRFERHRAWVHAVAFSPDGRLLASAGKDKTAQLWDLKTRELVWTFRGHTGPVRAALFTPDGKYLVTGGSDRTVRVWDVAREEQHALLGDTDPVRALALSGDGTLLAVAGEKAVRLWELNRGGPAQP